MRNSNRFKIICYLAWCGAEATYRLHKDQYDIMRMFLDKIAKIHVHGDELPHKLSASGITDYYVIEKRHRVVYGDFMQNGMK
jgi:hypothetical protein